MKLTKSLATQICNSGRLGMAYSMIVDMLDLQIADLMGWYKQGRIDNGKDIESLERSVYRSLLGGCGKIAADCLSALMEQITEKGNANAAFKLLQVMYPEIYGEDAPGIVALNQSMRKKSNLRLVGNPLENGQQAVAALLELSKKQID